MKTLLKLMVALLTMAWCGAFAQTSGVGLYSGSFTLIGVHTQTKNLRFSFGISKIVNNDNGFSVGVDSIANTSKLPVSRQSPTAIDIYYGLGLSASYWEGYGNPGINIFPHGAAGLLFTFDGLETSPFFVEFQPGFSVNNENGNMVVQGLRIPFRIGIIFK